MRRDDGGAFSHRPPAREREIATLLRQHHTDLLAFAEDDAASFLALG